MLWAAVGLILGACGGIRSESVSNTVATPPVEHPLSGAPTSAVTTGSTLVEEPAAPLEGWTVVVDPGHNGANGRHTAEINRTVEAGGLTKACNTTGTAGDDGWPEAAFNWEMALDLRVELENVGATVVFTRDDNEGWVPCIDERGRTAGEAGADVLISIHADGGPASGRGFHIIHPGSLAGLTELTTESSARLAAMVRARLIEAGLTPATYIGRDGLDQRDDLGTLNLSSAPSVMLELGNMRNPDDLAALRDPAWRAEVASALTGALVDHRHFAPQDGEER